MPNNARKTAGYTISDKEITESIPELKCHAPLIAASISFKMIPAAREGTPVHNQNFNVPGSPSRLRVLKSLKAYAAPVICPVSNSKAKNHPITEESPIRAEHPKALRQHVSMPMRISKVTAEAFFITGSFPPPYNYILFLREREYLTNITIPSTAVNPAT